MGLQTKLQNKAPQAVLQPLLRALARCSACTWLSRSPAMSPVQKLAPPRPQDPSLRNFGANQQPEARHF